LHFRSAGQQLRLVGPGCDARPIGSEGIATSDTFPIAAVRPSSKLVRMKTGDRTLRIGLASCMRLPEPDPDFEPLVGALRKRGCTTDSHPWDGRGDHRAFDAIVLRSTWNYYHQPQQFLSWIDRVASDCVLINPPPVVHWNIDKKYLVELRERGVPVVDTVWYERGASAAELPRFCRERDWSKLVIKPAIAAASFGSRVFAADQWSAATGYLQEELQSRDMLVQPYLDSIETRGETSIAWIDGQVTHAWTKFPRFAGQDERVGGVQTIGAAEMDVVEQAVDRWGDAIFYARIDLLYDARDRPRLSELELIEPSLYFQFSATGLDRFADGLLRWMRQRAAV
jgi:hypothetical protein